MLFLLILSLVNSELEDESFFTFRTGFKQEFKLESPRKYMKKNKIKMTKFIQKLFRYKENEDDQQKDWYYVHFTSNNISNILKLMNVDEKKEIIKNTYSMFLTKKQLENISNISLIKKIKPNEKFIEESTKLDDTDQIVVLASSNFNLQSNEKYIVESKQNENSFILHFKSNDLEKKKKIIKQLSLIPEVKTIITYKKPNLKNSFAAGFTQKNNFNFSYVNDFATMERYLNQNGINGEGQIITVMDSPLDFYHSMFRDEKVTVELNKYMPNHRKMVYYAFNGEMEDLIESMENSEHGTHTAGTAAGKSDCPNEGFDYSIFDGNAPEAKLLFICFRGSFDTSQEEKLMNTYHSIISTNSWGSVDYDTFLNYIWGGLAIMNPHVVFIYSAGNEYEVLNGNFSICDPGGSKNVLTVGALESFYNEVSKINMQSIDYEDVSCELIELNDGQDDLWFSGELGTEPGEADILVVDASKGNQCELIEVEGTSIIYGQLEDNWLSDCTEIPLKSRILYCPDESTMEQLLELGGKFLFQKSYEINEDVKIEHSSYSSTGPANKGILKPDVMAPGTRIISAKSNQNSSTPHGCLDNLEGDYLYMDGTSMATPNVAGGMALVHQYFNSGRWIEKVNLDGATSRALIINSCKHPKGSKEPDIIYGHGVVDLSTILPIQNDFGVQITHQEPNNKHSVSNNGHVIAKLKVNSKNIKRKLQITLSYIDPLLSIESPIPITRDLDMIVISPSKKFYFGDHLSSKDTQHTSTNEKIIIDEYDLENGEYIIHIYGVSFADVFNDDNSQRQEFSVVATGPIENGYLEFEDSYQCPCNKCDLDHPGYCQCDKNKNMGQVCQINIETISNNKSQITVKPLEIKRMRFISDKKIISVSSKSSNPGRGSTIWISKNCHLTLGEYEINGETGNETENDKVININFESKEICVAVFNFNDRDTTYNINIALGEYEKRDSKNNLIFFVCVALGSLIILIIIIVIVICCIKRKICCCRNSKAHEKSLLNSDFA